MKTAQVWDGPTAERLIQSDGYLDVGGDERGIRVYRFNDTALARIYGRLKAHSRTPDQRKIAETQERALERYFTAYVEGGLHGSLPSVDLGNACFAGTIGRDHAAKTDWQVDRRAEFRQANYTLSANQQIILKIIVLCGGSLEEAGRALGKVSRRRAIQSAERVLRDGAGALVELWGY